MMRPREIRTYTADAITIMPRGAEILTVAYRRGDFFVTASVDTNAPFVGRKLRTWAEGDEIEDGGQYICSIIGEKNWHVFDYGEERR